MENTVAAVLVPLVFAFAGCSGQVQRENTFADDFFDGKIAGEIVVSCYDSMGYRAFLEDAARTFEAAYPGIAVRVETFSAMPEVRTAGSGSGRVMLVENRDDPQGRADYISRVNTNLMSGAGADMYALDVLPLHRLVRGGMLENLDAYMEADPAFNREAYRKNILDAVRYRDGVWFLPLDYTFNYYAYDSTLVPAEIAAGFGPRKVWTAEALFVLGAELYDGSSKIFNTADYVRGGGGMFGRLVEENFFSLVDLENGRAYFSDGRFASILESAKNYGDRGYVPRPVTGEQNVEAIMRRAPEEEQDRYFFKYNGAFSLLAAYLRSTGQRIRIQTAENSAGIEDDDHIAGIAALGGGRVPFAAGRAFGINSRSKNKKAAWAFLHFLLSEDMQLSPSLAPGNFPLHNRARHEIAALRFSGSLAGRIIAPDDAQKQALEDYRNTVETLSDMINCYAVSDSSLSGMIAEEARHFFGGSRSAGETAAIVQTRASLYLDE